MAPGWRGESVAVWERWGQLGFGLFAGCVVGWLWSDRPDFVRNADLFQILTAVGTLGAVFVSVLSIRKADERADRQRKDFRDAELVKAKLNAALVRRHIAHSSARVRSLADRFNRAADGDTEAVKALQVLAEIEYELKHLERLSLPELAPLNPSIAALLALAISDLGAVQRRLQDEASLFDAIPSQPANQLFYWAAVVAEKSANRLRTAAHWYFAHV